MHTGPGISKHFCEKKTIYLISLFFLFGLTWEQLFKQSKQLDYYFSEKKNDISNLVTSSLEGGVLGSQMLHQGLVILFSLILKGSCSKILFFLVKIFIYFKQQIHEINSLKKNRMVNFEIL